MPSPFAENKKQRTKRSELWCACRGKKSRSSHFALVPVLGVRSRGWWSHCQPTSESSRVSHVGHYCLSHHFRAGQKSALGASGSGNQPQTTNNQPRTRSSMVTDRPPKALPFHTLRRRPRCRPPDLLAVCPHLITHKRHVVVPDAIRFPRLYEGIELSMVVLHCSFPGQTSLARKRSV